MARIIKFDSLPRAKNVTDRLVAVLLSARFMDEVLSGLPEVLMPTMRAHFGLSYTQISLLSLALNYVAAIIEPINGLLIDLWKRPWLMAWGAAGIGLATMVMGAAPTFAILLLGFALYGLASGPLAHTADVVLVESYPEAPDRIYSRATILDTLGALISPLLVSLVFFLRLDWRWLMIGLGFSSLLYAVIILGTRFPSAVNRHRPAELGWVRALRESLWAVLGNRQAWSWLLFMFVLAVLESPFHFTTVWLREQVGMSQALIGVYRVVEMAVSIVSLVFLERWLARMGYRRILLWTSFALLILYPIWLLTPGIWQRFLLSLPISFLFTFYWPIGKAQSLASVPGRGGTVTAIQSLLGLIPLPLFFGLLAEATSLTSAMFWVFTGGILFMLVVIVLMPQGAIEETAGKDAGV
jgi:MFS family permease